MSKQKSKPRKAKREGSRFFRVVYALLSRIVGAVFRIKVVNAENEPADGGFVVCANHISAADPIILSYAFKHHQLCFMAKKELFGIPVFSSLIRALGAFPVDRSGSDVGAIKNAVAIVDGGKCLGIFPQGHRYPEEEPRGTRTKNGAALIASRAEAPIVPAYIWRRGNKSGIFRRTYVIIGEKLPFENFDYKKDENGEYARITGIVFDRVCSLGESFEPKGDERRAKR